MRRRGAAGEKDGAELALPEPILAAPEQENHQILLRIAAYPPFSLLKS